MTTEYFVYDLQTGLIKRRLICKSGLERKANTYENEGVILAGEIVGVPNDCLMVELSTKQLQSINK
jgi:hypothetical protein